MPEPVAVVEGARPEPRTGAAPRWALAGLSAAVVVGVVIRFLTTSPLWLDEALSVNIASLPLGEIGAALRHDGHPPLYYWLLHGWTVLFGTGDVAVRSLSGAFSVATLPLAWMAGRRLAGWTGGAWALAVLALSPYAVRYATEARMYSLVMLLVSAGYVLLASVLRQPRRWSLALLAAVVGALLWTHYWSLYLLAVTGALLVWRWWRRPDQRRPTAAAIGAFVVGGLTFLPWLPSFLEQAAHTGTPWALPSRPTQVLDVTLADLGGGGFAEARLYGTVIVLLVFLAAFARRTGGGPVELHDRINPGLRDEVIAVAATLLLGVAAGYATQGAYASRYAAVVVPLVLVVAAVALALLRPGWLLGGLAAVVVGLGLVGLVKNVTTARTQAESLATSIVGKAGPRDVVVVCPDQLGPSVGRALSQEGSALEVVPYPAGGDARIVDWRDYAERNEAADPAAFAADVLAKAGDGRIWLVWNGSYRTFEGHCEALINRFGAVRQGHIVDTPAPTFETASLYWFG